MNGFVAVTDANFWRPSNRRFNLPVGTPFFFKLKSPYNAIAGFGRFASFTVLPSWLAWETFGEANGVESLDALRSRLQRIQVGARIEADPAGRIGCCLIAESRFFKPGNWVAAPSNWSPRTQTGAKVDLARGDGLRIWQECLARVALDTGTATPPMAAESAEPRYGAPSVYLPRLGQGIFRVQVLDAYGRACAVTGEHSLPVLEAAHIRPFSQGGAHRVDNGLALRTDLHRLFDKGYVTVDEQRRFIVGRRLKEEFENGRSYYGLHGHPVHLPKQQSFHPSATALAWHREQVFRG